MAAKDKFNKIRADITKRLHEPSPVKDVLDKIEQKTGVDRFFLFTGVCLIFGAYMIFGYFAGLVCNSIGFLYPAYMSCKAIDSVDKADDTQWLTYWVVFAVFSVVEFFADAIVGWFPLYWLLKCLFMLYMHLPQFRGTERIYKKYIRPFIGCMSLYVLHVTTEAGEADSMSDDIYKEQ